MNKLPKTVRSISPERTPMQEQAPRERVQNFDEVALGYQDEQAVMEADRCLDCKDARCLRGCPVSIDIPSMLRKVAARDFHAAYETLAHTNALPAVCGRVCPQEAQCEGVCTVGDVVEPVAIGRIERWLGEMAIERGWSAVRYAEPNGFRVGIVGSGPAGIACAADLAKLGCQVTIFEALHAPGGVLRYGIPEFRLPKRIVDAELAKLQELGVKIECNTLVGRLFTIEQMREELGFHAVFIATGAGLPKFMRIPGESLHGVLSANELLTRCNLMQAGRFPEFDTPLGLGRRVAVIGAGNTAMDALRVAKRVGAEQVLCVYRRSRNECPARAEELHHAEQEGIEFHWLTNPTAILGDESGKVRALRCVRMQLGAPDASGRRSPEVVPDSEIELEVDMVVYAIGTNANPVIGQTAHIALNRWGYIATDEHLSTSLAGVFAGGDIVTGSATVILAMGAGRRAARSIAQYLGIAEAEPAVPNVFGVDASSHAFVRMRAKHGAYSRSPGQLVPAALRPLLPVHALRHPYPLVLASGIRPLRAWVDDALHELHADNEALTHAALQLEARLRSLVCKPHATPPLTAAAELRALAWEIYPQLLAAVPEAERAALAPQIQALIAALPEAALAACDTAGLEHTIERLWRESAAARSGEVCAELQRLERELARLAHNDVMTTPAAWSSSALTHAFGASQRADLDFELLSQLLTKVHAPNPKEPARLGRIRKLRRVLAQTHVFGLEPSHWVFRSCAELLDVLTQRLGEVSRLLDAVAQAHLETRAAVRLAPSWFQTDAFALLPTSLLMLDVDTLTEHEHCALLQLLSTRLPLRVLCRSNSLVHTALPRALFDAGSGIGGPAARLAALGCGLGHVRVVQTTLACLPGQLAQLRDAFSYAGPVLLAVYTGEGHPHWPPYLAAAAAHAARVFPSFSFDPDTRHFDLSGNVAPLAAWPRAAFASEDPELGRVEHDEAFTAAHWFASLPASTAEHSVLASDAWDSSLVPLDADHGEANVKPYVSMVDERDQLLRVIVSGPLHERTRQVAQAWRRLQLSAASLAQPFKPEPKPEPEPEPASVKPTDTGAYLETSRCSSCDECLKRAPHMFIYNADRRAQLRDVRAGSYRSLVEAAEHCAMAVIHPGKPWDPSEPGLEELQRRAAALNLPETQP